MNKTNLCGLTVEELYGLIGTGGFEFKHAVAVAGIIYKKGSMGLEHTSRIPKRLKAFLGHVSQTGFYSPSASEVSSDGTVKYLFRTFGGKQFETVFIPDLRRNTVCVSTQAGCRMGCPFCVTGKYGFHGNLSAGDIVNQVISIPFTGKTTHIVFMGMGEPLDNLENVLKACNIITAEWGMAFSPRNVTISTVGITQAVQEFLERSDCNLALSLYSPFAVERIRIIPAERAYPAGEIIRVMKNYPLKKKRRLSIAYVMMDGINDTDRHLEKLKAMLKDTGIRINLLPYHPVKYDMNRSSAEERMQFFKHNLVISGISASIRKSRGADISAACGLLASGF
jgi:23S rRNA (adenine2503-C2)-methyltransferase